MSWLGVSDIYSDFIFVIAERASYPRSVNLQNQNAPDDIAKLHLGQSSIAGM